jgi:hypothetical protein
MGEYGLTRIMDDPMALAWQMHDFCLGAECCTLFGKLRECKRIPVAPKN